jgi:hypothetical protein
MEGIAVKHRGVEAIGAERLTEAIGRTPLDQYVVWTGYPLDGQAGSLRARALHCISEVGTPVPLRAVLQRAARLETARGLDPDAVRAAIRLHQVARRAVYLLVQRLPSNAFVAVTDIPAPAGVRGRICAGETVIEANGRPRFVALDREVSVAVS